MKGIYLETVFEVHVSILDPSSLFFLHGKKSRENDFQLVSRVDPSANPFWTINSHPKDIIPKDYIR